MQYGKILLKEIPTPVLAHEYKGSQYNVLLPECKNKIEITFIEEGNIFVQKGERGKFEIPVNSIFVNLFKEDLHGICPTGLQRHITVGFTLDYEVIPVSAEHIIACNLIQDPREAFEKNFAILPLEVGLQLPENSKVPNLIRKIIQIYPISSAANKLVFVSLVMNLLSEITQECVRQSFVSVQISPSNIMKAEKAIAYIKGNINRKMKVEEIAQAVELSPGYLSNIFKTVTGQTLTEYINRTKVQLAKELVLNHHMSFSEAGEYVGIEDSSYLSRLFRKYMDTSMREMKSNQNVIIEL